MLYVLCIVASWTRVLGVFVRILNKWLRNMRLRQKTKDKGLPRDKNELTVIASWDVRECELRCRELQINYLIILIIMRYCD